MFKVFVEYAIKPEWLESYLIYMQELCKREGRLELLEGTDQPGLFVELWEGITYEQYESLKRSRFEGEANEAGQGSWEEWIVGGRKKLHMWHFTQVTLTAKKPLL